MGFQVSGLELRSNRWNFVKGVVSAVALTAIVGTALATPTFADEWDYLKRKWREDVSDPSTGLAAPALRAEIEKAMPQWKAELPWPDAKAKAFAFLCDRTAIDVSPYDWFPTFAYWTRHTFKLHPFWDQVGIRKGEVFAKWKFSDHPYRKYWRGYPDFDHSAPDWDDILKLGFPGMAERLKANWKATDYYPPRQVAIDGVMRLLDRFIACGEGKVKELKGNGLKGLGSEACGRVEKQVESLKRLRAGAPQTAYDALNFIYLYWVISENFEGIQVRTLGNLDRLVAPYYRADLAAGRTTETEFRSQLRHFWWQWGSIDNYYGQPVYFGGTKADGTTEYSEVSKIMLDVHDELALATPKLHLKVGRSTPDWVWRKTIDMARRMRPISFIGEEPHARVIKSMGYTDDEAREFMVWGCYEWAIRDSANDTFGASVNLPKTIETLLADAAAGRFAPADYASFKAACRKLISEVVADARSFALEDERDLAAVNPSFLFSLAARHSVETGKDAYCGGMLHGNNTGIWMVGLASTIDSIAAVKELVYDRREMSLADLGRIMAANWKDHEPLRLRMARSKRKWGNNDPDANAIARELSGWIAKEVNGHANARGGHFKVHGHTARWHYGYGADVGATPDGRRKGEEISKNISPVMGADTEGVTALVASAANLDACDLPGDFPLDVALLPNTVAGEKGIDMMRAVIDTYFANGGLVIQFNVHDAATLRDAQRHPERYANLQVRVTGWNVRWNDIPKAEQDKFILRAESIIQ